jgi:phosphohistidine phosphatase
MCVKLYLIRHGIAIDREEFEGEDAQRPLTAQGERKTRRIAQRLQDLDLKFDHLLTSPLLRAHQTAEILQQTGLADKLEVVDFLSPRGDFGEGLTWLSQWQHFNNKSLAWVGHEPDLSQWAEILIWGEARQVLQLKKGGAIGLMPPQEFSPIGNCTLFWLTPPGLFL